jgi:hypothetical protein
MIIVLDKLAVLCIKMQIFSHSFGADIFIKLKTCVPILFT